MIQLFHEHIRDFAKKELSKIQQAHIGRRASPKTSQVPPRMSMRVSQE